MSRGPLVVVLLLGISAFAVIASLFVHRPGESNREIAAEYGEPAPQAAGIRCDQAATTADCGQFKVVKTSLAADDQYRSEATSYAAVASTSQSGKVDGHVTVDDSLRDVAFCAKTYKSRQIFIDGVDVIQRIAKLATNAAATDERSIGHLICEGMPSNMEYINGILETSDVTLVDRTTDKRLPGDTYQFAIGGEAFLVNVPAGTIYWSSSYDGRLFGPIGQLR